MENNFIPKTHLGKWSVGLTIFFLLLIIVFFAFMLFGLVTFDEGHWWDWTVGIAVPLVISAFITGIIAVKKNKDHSILVFISIFIGLLTILFLLFHSLFIND
jgi:cytochrome bd-type quinol oxidase subunit 2